MTTDQKIDEVLKLVKEQGQQLLLIIQEQGERHERRFDVMEEKLVQVEQRLDAKIDKVFDALSQDIQAFSQDLGRVSRRVSRLEKTRLS